MNKLVFLLLLLSLISCTQGTSDFELCGIGVIYPYYFSGLKYNGEIYEIEKEIKKNWIIPETNNNGIAKVRFRVNCHGDLGDLHYEEYDSNYVQTELNSSIEKQLMKNVSNLSDWIVGRNVSGDACNSHGFLSFRIEQGIITEILPK